MWNWEGDIVLHLTSDEQAVRSYHKPYLIHAYDRQQLLNGAFDNIKTRIFNDNPRPDAMKIVLILVCAVLKEDSVRAMVVNYWKERNLLAEGALFHAAFMTSTGKRLSWSGDTPSKFGHRLRDVKTFERYGDHVKMTDQMYKWLQISIADSAPCRFVETCRFENGSFERCVHDWYRPGVDRRARCDNTEPTTAKLALSCDDTNECEKVCDRLWPWMPSPCQYNDTSLINETTIANVTSSAENDQWIVDNNAEWIANDTRLTNYTDVKIQDRNGTMPWNHRDLLQWCPGQYLVQCGAEEPVVIGRVTAEPWEAETSAESVTEAETSADDGWIKTTSTKRTYITRPEKSSVGQTREAGSITIITTTGRRKLGELATWELALIVVVPIAVLLIICLVLYVHTKRKMKKMRTAAIRMMTEEEKKANRAAAKIAEAEQQRANAGVVMPITDAASSSNKSMVPTPVMQPSQLKGPTAFGTTIQPSQPVDQKMAVATPITDSTGKKSIVVPKSGRQMPFGQSKGPTGISFGLGAKEVAKEASVQASLTSG